MKRLSFITQFKIELLLPFSGCRKVPGKMPDNELVCCTPVDVLYIGVHCTSGVKYPPENHFQTLSKVSKRTAET